MAKFIIVIGLIISLTGISLYFFGDYFKWIGNLPGDFKIEKENFKFYFPFTTMLIVAVVFNVLMRLVKWIMG